jgi:hypothetical protein
MIEDDSLLYMKTHWPFGKVIHEVKDINVRHDWYLKCPSDYSSFLLIMYNVKILRLFFVNFATFFTKTYLRKCVRSLFRLHFTLTFLKYVCTEIAEFQFFTDLL